MIERAGEYLPLDDTRLTAMGGYLGLLAGWRPEPIAAPVLLARAIDSPNERWLSGWPPEPASVAIPGNHFTIVEENSPTTADAVNEWLAETLQEKD